MDSIIKIAPALVAAQKLFAPALKKSNNPYFNSKYADLSACVEAVIDALNNNGIFLFHKTEEHQDGVIVETVFLHESGEQITAGKIFMPVLKKGAQEFGSALTYARRYSLMSACGIAPEDDDGNAASKQPKKPTSDPTRPPEHYPSEWEDSLRMDEASLYDMLAEGLDEKASEWIESIEKEPQYKYALVSRMGKEEQLRLRRVWREKRKQS